MFIFGGQDEKGYHDSLYAFGTNSSGGLSWTLMRGNKTMNSVGRYGSFKALSVDNYPSARSGACMDFITSSHSIMFGGRGVDSAGEEGFLNDLWIAEDMTQFGWYAGSQKINQPSVMSGKDATPSGRWKHTCGSHFESKKFVVFGGMGQHPKNPKDTAILDDLYAYGENGWEFLTGGSHSQAPDFKNKEKKMRNPGSRAEHSSVMVEKDFFTFGGQSVMLDKKSGGLVEVMMADLWRYDMIARQWFFMGGTQLANSHGSYPSEIGTGSKKFGPGARVMASIAFNQLTNEIFIFGGFGYGYVRGEVGYLNDLWSYNPVEQYFTWYGGSSGINSAGSDKLPKLPSARSSGLLFSGNDGLESELTLIGGVQEESKDTPSAIADVWMVNVKVPPAFSRPAPETTNPPTTRATSAADSSSTTTAPDHSDEGENRKRDGDDDGDDGKGGDDEEDEDATRSKSTKSTFHKTDTTRKIRKHTDAPRRKTQSLFDGGPQKVAGIVMGSFVAVILLVGGIVFLGFSFVSNSSPSGSRVVLEPYTSV
jgi:hypothetical protein